MEFDRKINVGNMLTVGALVVAGFSAWGSMDTRLTKLEESKAHMNERVVTMEKNQEARMAEVNRSLNEMRSDIKEILLRMPRSK